MCAWGKELACLNYLHRREELASTDTLHHLCTCPRRQVDHTFPNKNKSRPLASALNRPYNPSLRGQACP
jgi:hypothetical protein